MRVQYGFSIYMTTNVAAIFNTNTFSRCSCREPGFQFQKHCSRPFQRLVLLSSVVTVHSHTSANMAFYLSVPIPPTRASPWRFSAVASPGLSAHSNSPGDGLISRFTLIEGSDRLGGWLRSSSVDVGTGNVVFEQGPRNLRPSWPNGHVTLGLVSCKYHHSSMSQWVISRFL